MIVIKYALLNNNQVTTIENRGKPFEYYHPDIAKQFIECDDNVEIGDTYKDGVFVKEGEINA